MLPLVFLLLVNVCELFLDFGHIFVGLSDIIPLTVSDISSPRKLIYISLSYL